VKNNQKIKIFDIILVYTIFRKNETYLNIIKSLSKDFSIGIFLCQPSGKKTQDTDKAALAYYKRLGATVINGKSKCKILYLSRFGEGRYQEIFEDLPKIIQFNKVFLQTGTLMEGLQGVNSLNGIIKYLGKPKILVPSKRYFGTYEKESLKLIKKNSLEVIEVGQPYFKYPVFEDFRTDYLIAYPSHLSIVNPFQHYLLLKNYVKIVMQLPKNVRIMVKPHNVKDKGNHISQTIFKKKLFFPLSINKYILLCIYQFDFFLRIIGLLEWVPKRNTTSLKKRIFSLVNSFQNSYIFTRCENILDNYPAFGIEHFMKGVSKGIITGLSNSIYVALMHKVPVCVCDSDVSERQKNYKIMIEKFRVNSWKNFSEEGFELIDESVRNADLIHFLSNSIKREK